MTENKPQHTLFLTPSHSALFTSLRVDILPNANYLYIKFCLLHCIISIYTDFSMTQHSRNRTNRKIHNIQYAIQISIGLIMIN